MRDLERLLSRVEVVEGEEDMTGESCEEERRKEKEVG